MGPISFSFFSLFADNAFWVEWLRSVSCLWFSREYSRAKADFVCRSLLLNGTLAQSLIGAMIFAFVDFTVACEHTQTYHLSTYNIHIPSLPSWHRLCLRGCVHTWWNERFLDGKPLLSRFSTRCSQIKFFLAPFVVIWPTALACYRRIWTHCRCRFGLYSCCAWLRCNTLHVRSWYIPMARVIIPFPSRIVSFVSLWYVSDHACIPTPAITVWHKIYAILRFFVGFIIAGLRVSRTSETEYPANPMKVSVSPKVLALLVLASLVGSTVSLDFPLGGFWKLQRDS